MDFELTKILKGSFTALCRNNKVFNVGHFLNVNSHYLHPEDRIVEAGWINAAANNNVDILYIILHFVFQHNYDFDPRFNHDAAFRLAEQYNHIDTLEFMIKHFSFYTKELTWPDSINMVSRYYIIDQVELNTLFELCHI
jgi:hypothetical protein